MINKDALHEIAGCKLKHLSKYFSITEIRNPEPENKILFECGMYMIVNTSNDKKYVGVTSTTFRERLMSHNRDSSKSAISNAIRSCPAAFKYVILFVCDRNNFDFSKIKELEINTILYFDSYKNGYNRTLGGESLIRNHQIDEATGLPWVQIAVSNGLKPSTFRTRVSRGKDLKQASQKQSYLNTHPKTVTIEMIEAANKLDLNVVSRGTFFDRIKKGLSIDEAARPARNLTGDIEREKFCDMANQRGISRSLFNSRIKKGMTFFDAATNPPRSKPKNSDLNYWKQIAIKNGIRINTFRQRIYKSKMTAEEAATTSLSDKKAA